MLRSDPIVVSRHDPAWSERFRVERQGLEPLLQPWIVRPIEHIGSTAVPGLDAKPIIDMLAVVENIDAFDAAVDAPAGLGWHAAPEPSDVELRRRSWCRPDVAQRTHHLHVVEEGSDHWRSWIAFRDILCRHAPAAAEYATLKHRLAAQFGSDPNERDAYRRGKAAFIRRTLQSFQDAAAQSRRPLLSASGSLGDVYGPVFT